MFSEWFRRLWGTFRRSRRDSELEEELRLHLELAGERMQEQGDSSEQARRKARLKAGAITQAMETMRDQRGLPWLENVLQDIRYGFRSLRRSPGFTAVTVGILALGIGLNTAVFTVMKTMVLGGMPGVDPDGRILYIGTHPATRQAVSYADVEDWRAETKSFVDLAAVLIGDNDVSLNDERGFPETYVRTVLSTNAFQVLRVRPVLGRDFVASDGAPGAIPVTILSYGLWTSRYGRNPDIVGQTIRISDVPTEVVGVMPPGFGFPLHGITLWSPFGPTQLPGLLTVDLQKRDARSLFFAFGRMAEGVTIQSARAEMEAIGKRLAIAYPDTNRDVIPRVSTFSELFVGVVLGSVTTYLVMWGAVGFLLLIVWANLANLMLARAISRTREISLRSALGAGRTRIICQLLTESVMLSAAGGALGVAIAALTVEIYQRAQESVPQLFQWPYALDFRVFAYLLAISLVTGLVFGLAPALRLSRLDINSVLKDGGRGSMGGRRGKHLSTLLVMGEMALAVALLAGAGVMIRSFLNVYTADLGIDPRNILRGGIQLFDERYASREAQMAYWRRLMPRLEALPGVESLAVASSNPGGYARPRSYEVEGARPPDGQPRSVVPVVAISPPYFQTLGAGMLAGRAFSDSDGFSGTPIVIVNKRLADTIWPGENPIGKRLRFFVGETAEPWRTVIGISSNIVQNDSTRNSFKPIAYLPYMDVLPGFGEIFLRTRVPPESLTSDVLREIRAIDPNVVVEDPTTLKRILTEGSWSRALNAGVFFVFSAFGLLLAAFGLYALVAHSIGQRTQEIGVRVAMGATAGDIRRMVFRQGMFPLGTGLTIGLAASLVLNRVLEAGLVGVSSADPLILLIAAAVLVVAALLGCWIPARRAMRVDPSVALRHD